MIKVAGKWVAPKEVEDALMMHPKVKECAVVGRKDDSGLYKAFAHVILQDSSDQVDNEDDYTALLVDHLSQLLDRYKLPKSISFHVDFPRTHLGKIDRKSL